MGDGHGERLTLASLDVLGDSDELRERARRLLRERGGDTRPARRHEGTDPSGSVRVAVDGRGRVTDVDVDATWRQRVGASGFPGALFEAYTAAVRTALEAAALAAVEARSTSPSKAWPQRAPEAGSRPSVGPRAPAPEREVDERAWLRRTWATLDGIDAQLSRLSQSNAAAGPGERDVSSPDGLLTLRMRGRGVTGVTGDARLLAVADPQRLRREALAAFRAAALATEV